MPDDTFGHWLKTRRKELDLTRSQVAQRVGCAEITLGKIERDERRPSKQIAELLAAALQIPQEQREGFVHFARGLGAMPAPSGDPAPRRRQVHSNLPVPLTSFIGRARELAGIRARLMQPDVRLLTLVGPPGIGKTRLSIQTGHLLRDQFADGVWFVALAPLSDPQLVLPAIARVFDITEAAPNVAVERMQGQLGQHELLLILDNFEQVLSAGSHVAELLKACPKMKMLATSRELLCVYGEHEYPVPGLSSPKNGTTVATKQLAELESAKLFVARAQAFKPTFEWSTENVQAVADICIRLDGLPLAIELAAAQLRQLTPQKLAASLETQLLQSLVGIARDVEPRQRTLRGAIQWSHDLLSPRERAAFRQLGVFVGGFTADAARNICDLTDDAILHSLDDRSLLKRDSNERWSMLEMMREFALDALAQSSPEALSQTRQRHADYYAVLICEADRIDGNDFWKVLDEELPNARAALRWLIDHGAPDTGVLADVLGGYWEGRGMQVEGARWLDEILASQDAVDILTRAALLGRISNFRWQLGDLQAALTHAQELVTIFRQNRAPSDVAQALILMGRIYIESGQYESSGECLSEALSVVRAVNDIDVTAGALVHLGEIRLALGDLAQAETLFRESHARCMTLVSPQHVWLSLACVGLGSVYLARREYDHAFEILREGLRHAVFARLRLMILDTFAGAIGTMPHRTMADVQYAARIWGAAQALREKIGTEFAPHHRKRIDAWIAQARSRISAKVFEAAWAEGRERSLDEALEMALDF